MSMLKINGTESPPVYLDDDGHVVKSDKTWKDRVREREIVIDSREMYGPADVAAYLDVSYDTAIRRMWKMPGVVNLGTKEKLHRRGKAILRIPGKNLLVFLSNS